MDSFRARRRVPARLDLLQQQAEATCALFESASTWVARLISEGAGEEWAATGKAREAAGELSEQGLALIARGFLADTVCGGCLFYALGDVGCCPGMPLRPSVALAALDRPTGEARVSVERPRHAKCSDARSQSWWGFVEMQRSCVTWVSGRTPPEAEEFAKADDRGGPWGMGRGAWWRTVLPREGVL